MSRYTTIAAVCLMAFSATQVSADSCPTDSCCAKVKAYQVRRWAYNTNNFGECKGCEGTFTYPQTPGYCDDFETLKREMEHDGAKYLFEVKNKYSFNGAKQVCTDWNKDAHIVYYDSNEERAWVDNRMESQAIWNMWYGCTRGTNGKWTYNVDGSDCGPDSKTHLNPTKWQANQADNQDGKECAIGVIGGFSIRLAAGLCTNTQYVVCKVGTPDPTTTSTTKTTTTVSTTTVTTTTVTTTTTHTDTVMQLVERKLDIEIDGNHDHDAIVALADGIASVVDLVKDLTADIEALKQEVAELKGGQGAIEIAMEQVQMQLTNNITMVKEDVASVLDTFASMGDVVMDTEPNQLQVCVEDCDGSVEIDTNGNGHINIPKGTLKIETAECGEFNMCDLRAAIAKVVRTAKAAGQGKGDLP